MKSAIILSLVSLAFGSAIEPRACGGNNCNRQVIGTRAGLPAVETRSVDCASFLRVTVTPATRTITSTLFVSPSATPVKRDVEVRAVEPRQVTVSPSAIPTYAAACGDRAEYASACSCLGLTAATTTVRSPRTTTTVTVQATACASLAINAVPSCAYDCFLNLIPSYGCTGLDDLACQCASFEPIGIAVTPCVVAACTHQEVEAIFPAAAKGCACYSAANPVPTAV